MNHRCAVNRWTSHINEKVNEKEAIVNPRAEWAAVSVKHFEAKNGFVIHTHVQFENYGESQCLLLNGENAQEGTDAMFMKALEMVLTSAPNLGDTTVHLTGPVADGFITRFSGTISGTTIRTELMTKDFYRKTFKKSSIDGLTRYAFHPNVETFEVREDQERRGRKSTVNLTLSDGTRWGAVSVKSYPEHQSFILHAAFRDGDNFTVANRMVPAAGFTGETRGEADVLIDQGMTMLRELAGDLTGITVYLVGVGAKAYVQERSRAHASTGAAVGRLTPHIYADTIAECLDNPAHQAAFVVDNGRFIAPDNMKDGVAGSSEGTPESETVRVQKTIPASSTPVRQRWGAVSLKNYPAKRGVLLYVHYQDGENGTSRRRLFSAPGNDSKHSEWKFMLDVGLEMLTELSGDIDGMRVYFVGQGVKPYLDPNKQTNTRGAHLLRLSKEIYGNTVAPSLSDEVSREAFAFGPGVFHDPEHTDTDDLEMEPAPGTVVETWDEKNHWAAISVKHHLVRGFPVIHVHHQNGDARIQKRIFVDSDHVAATTEEMYQLGMSTLFEMEPDMASLPVYLTGTDVDALLNKIGCGIDGTGITFHKMDLLFAETAIKQNISSRARRFAFDPTTDLYCDPARMDRQRTVLHVHSDASQTHHADRGMGYGHGVVVHNDDTDIIEAHSTWNLTPAHYHAHQYELDGVLAAVEHCVDQHGPEIGTLNQLAIIVHCDSMSAVQQIEALSHGTPKEREAVLAAQFGEHARVINRDWMGRSNIIVEAHWVKGHNGDARNEVADRLATAARRFQQGILGYDGYLHQVHSQASLVGAVPSLLEEERPAKGTTEIAA